MGSNIDQREIAKFEAQASQWWNPQGVLKSLHDINPLRLQYVDDRCQLDGKKVLDVGCGGGLLTEAMARKGAFVTGIDMGRAPLAVARMHQQEARLNIVYQQATIEHFAARHPAAFDVATCMELLEHVPEPRSVVQACAAAVRTGGHVFFATINRNIKAFVYAIIGAEWVLRLLPKGTHQYHMFIRSSDLKKWARESDLVCSHMTGLHYHLFGRRYSLGGNTHVNYLAHFRKR